MEESAFSTIVKNRLNDVGENISWLADQAHISRSHLNNLLDGRRRWNDDMKARVCKALNIVVEYRCVV